MARKYCYLVNIVHHDGCSEDYVVCDISQVSSCIDDYLSEYSCSLCLDRLEIHISQIIWKGDKKDG